jgi:hypothetical protein
LFLAKLLLNKYSFMAYRAHIKNTHHRGKRTSRRDKGSGSEGGELHGSFLLEGVEREEEDEEVSMQERDETMR